ncbi:GspH/FimT family pseudopilin [Dyella jiangningensis]|uniref:Type II secretion system protein H n=1 Tax=Dyella jiangningensis TaxID=1379159 RepID=A0A328P0H0_9GAMM|nr:GspH/FimT family pseudopilin [Dyella jiangningensis]RAO74873.1 type II secretion system protein GspH [Dyella jiangningensis]
MPAASPPVPSSPDRGIGRGGRSRGFTLLEMLAVILLIGIAAAAVAVSVTQGLASARVAAASGELAAALRATRTQAIVHGNEHTFDVDTRANTYRADDGKVVRLPTGMRIGITSAKEDQVSATTGRIRFFPDGSSTGGHITLQRNQRQWRVNVSWLTGAVSVADVSGRK